MNIQELKRRCMPDRGCCYFGGDSDSATTSTTEINDMRVVGGDNSSNTSIKAGGNVTMTDHGAVKAGLDLGSKAIEANRQGVGTVLASANDMFTGALDAVSASNERLALAYQSGQAGDQVQLKYAGFAVVGLAAVALLPKLFKG